MVPPGSTADATSGKAVDYSVAGPKLSTAFGFGDRSHGFAPILAGVVGEDQVPDVLVVAPPGPTQDLILASATAHDRRVEVVTATVPVNRWRAAHTVVVAQEQAAGLARVGHPARERVFLVGGDAQELSRWSTPLAAQVILLPTGQHWLGEVLAEPGAQAHGVVVAVVGATGGVGASTLAVALAQRATQEGGEAAVVDLDPFGGGLDLLLGAERVEGWRWPQLAGASGQVGDLRSYLPVVDGVSLVATSREPGPEPGVGALEAVVASLRAWHPMVVLDVGRVGSVVAQRAVQTAGRVLLITSTAVRAVAAARTRAGLLDRPGVGLVLRPTRNGVPPGLVAEVVGLPVLGILPHEPGLVAAAEFGEPPLRRVRRGYRRALSGLVADLLGEVGGG